MASRLLSVGHANSSGCAPSGSSGEMVVRIAKKRHHFLQRDNVERSNRTYEFQPVAHGLSGIEHFELNLMVVSPSFEKDHHAEATAFKRAHLREIEHDNSGVFKRRHCSTEIEG